MVETKWNNEKIDYEKCTKECEKDSYIENSVNKLDDDFIFDLFKEWVDEFNKKPLWLRRISKPFYKNGLTIYMSITRGINDENIDKIKAYKNDKIKLIYKKGDTNE